MPKSSKQKRQHDAIYRRIFDRAEMMEDILRLHAAGPWAARFDFSTLARVPADFIAKYLKKYEADILWRVRYGPEKGDWFYVFVLMELQSTVERFMALRVLGYVLRLCEALLEHREYLVSRRPRLLPRCWRWCCTMEKRRGQLRCPRVSSSRRWRALRPRSSAT